MAKLHYCERAPTHFPVVFAGEAFMWGREPHSTCPSLATPFTAESESRPTATSIPYMARGAFLVVASASKDEDI